MVQCTNHFRHVENMRIFLLDLHGKHLLFWMGPYVLSYNKIPYKWKWAENWVKIRDLWRILRVIMDLVSKKPQRWRGKIGYTIQKPPQHGIWGFELPVMNCWYSGCLWGPMGKLYPVLEVKVLMMRMICCQECGILVCTPFWWECPLILWMISFFDLLWFSLDLIRRSWYHIHIGPWCRGVLWWTR